VPYFPAYLLLGVVLWTFFVEATQSGMNAITGRGDMVRKVKIPKYIIVLSTTVSAFINFCLNLIVVAVFMVLGDVPFRWTIALAPIFIAELILLALAFAYLLSALFVKFRDIGHIWEVILQAFFYITPIIYPLSIVPEKFAKLTSLSPLTQIFQDMRSVVITPETLTTKQVFGSQFIGRGIPLLVIIGLSVFAIWYFQRSSPKFAEEL
jgi:ABC-2 type transport system permease protein